MKRVRLYLPITLLLTAALLVGLFTVRDYGESWDEADLYRYADYALGSYQFFFHPGQLPAFETNLNLYGPAYYMAAAVLANAATAIAPGWSKVDAWHFIYFLTFLSSALSVYLLARRWTGEAASLGATALFLSQPLLWGHAFINPKDIPFMALFAGSIVTGLAMVDRRAARQRFIPMLLAASLLLGLTASFRVIGPLAGLIVLAYAIYKLGRRVVPVALAYFGIALVIAFLTWPYLWSAPVAHYLESIQTMSQFPFATLILFNGQLYKANELPRTYFPTLLSLQLTEPALLLLLLGTLSSILLWTRGQYREPSALFLAWFLIPALIIAGSRSPLYDNGRQLYFLLPPIFVLIGIALERLFSYAFLAHPAAQAALVLVAALPGILLSARLHPYEYVYYNSLAGGTGGAFRKYEMDYWGTSMKEMTEYVDATVPPNARLLVFGPEQIVASYARSDIQAFIPGNATGSGYDYAILLTRENLDERRCKGAETVHEIGRRGAVFAVLKKIPSGVECK